MRQTGEPVMLFFEVVESSESLVTFQNGHRKPQTDATAAPFNSSTKDAFGDCCSGRVRGCFGSDARGAIGAGGAVGERVHRVFTGSR